MMSTETTIVGHAVAGSSTVLTSDALAFVTRLHREFNSRRETLLQVRRERQARWDAGESPDFLPETESVRSGGWTVAPTPDDLQNRRVEITGPVDRKMVINALNSGANVFMADFEDALSPTWDNVVQGQVNMRDAVRRTIEFTNPDGREYRLNDEIATLIVRPRGWHLVERHVLIDGEPVSASLFDFGLYLFHNAEELLSRGSGPYFYLPKMESHLEARLWADVFRFAEEDRGISSGTIRATMLIETLLAAFEMDEILYELRDYAAGLNAGRWDYIFSAIKVFRSRADKTLPDRAQVTMAVPFMRAYSQLLVKTCHRRGAHAIGGMSAFIPSRDPAVNETAMANVQADKQREATTGFDGAWVAHPALIPVAREIFDAVIGDNHHQKHQLRDEVTVTASELADIKVPDGTITEAGVRNNINVALQYVNSWFSGNGAAAIHNLMEDAATAEISRAQLWQWIRHGASMDDGRAVTADLYSSIRDEELASLRGGSLSHIDEAAALLDQLVLDDGFADFLTLPAYERLE